jgi:hypothetical protein
MVIAVRSKPSRSGAGQQTRESAPVYFKNRRDQICQKRPLSMRKTHEILRLSALGMKRHQIASSCAIMQSNVHKYLKLTEAAHLISYVI